jgi:uncharacterized protein
MRIKQRLVLITGASSGIGAATATAMARRGGRVLLLARTQAALEQLATTITDQGGTAHVYPVDLADLRAVAEVAHRIKTEVGIPDILINNAGAGRWLFTEETDPSEAVQIMQVPYIAAFAMTQAFLPEMLQRNRGHIVNLTSPSAYLVWPGTTAYTAARWAMRGFTEALRAELQATGIRVTLVTPGGVASPYWAHNPGMVERLPTITKVYPTLTPEQVAAAIVRGVERNQREVILPWSVKLTILLHRLLPRPVQWVFTKTGAQRPPPAARNPQRSSGAP